MAGQVLDGSLLMNCVALMWLRELKPAVYQSIMGHQQAWKSPRQHPIMNHSHLEG